MRISDWSSDVCSSDLPSSASAGMYPGGIRVRSLSGTIVVGVPKAQAAQGSSSSISSVSSVGGVIIRTIASTDIRSEEHTSELQSLMRISYAVFCLKKKKTTQVLKQVRPTTDMTTQKQQQ